MTKIISVTLDQKTTKFIDGQVAQGKFRSPADVIEAGLRLLRHEVEDGQSTEGEGSVKLLPFNFDEFLKDHYRRHSV